MSPTKLATPCRTPRCPAIAGPRGLCAGHARAYERSPQRQAAKAFYGTPEWRALRRFVLLRDPVCKLCDRARSTQADHKTPRSQGGTDDPANLQGLCNACHSRKGASENRGDGGRWG